MAASSTTGRPLRPTGCLPAGPHVPHVVAGHSTPANRRTGASSLGEYHGYMQRTCACGCGETLTGSAQKRYINTTHRSRAHRGGGARRPRETRTCACGCGEALAKDANPNRVFVDFNHRERGREGHTRTTERIVKVYLPAQIAEQVAEAARSERMPQSTWLRQLILSTLGEPVAQL